MITIEVYRGTLSKEHLGYIGDGIYYYKSVTVSKEIHIELYRHDGSLCIAMVDEKPVSRVDRSYVIDLVETVHAIVLD